MTQTIFIIDDDDRMRLVLGQLLETYGFAVRSFDRPADFLDMASPRLSGCVIIDVRMPETDGLTFQRQMQDAGIDLPVIFLSAYADVSVSVRAMQQGALTFLEKPCRDQELVDAVRTALALERDTREDRQEKQRLREAVGTLDARERAILEDLANGELNKTIASRLGLSEITIKVIRGRIMRKMGAPSIAHLARFFEKLRR